MLTLKIWTRGWLRHATLYSSLWQLTRFSAKNLIIYTYNKIPIKCILLQCKIWRRRWSLTLTLTASRSSKSFRGDSPVSMRLDHLKIELIILKPFQSVHLGMLTLTRRLLIRSLVIELNKINNQQMMIKFAGSEVLVISVPLFTTKRFTINLGCWTDLVCLFSEYL
jgi:hypothetical protein